MRRTTIVSAVGAAAIGTVLVLSGCGSSKKAIDELRDDQRRLATKLQTQLGALTETLDDVKRQTDSLRTSLSFLEDRVGALEIRGGGSVVDRGPRHETNDDDDVTPKNTRIEPVEAGTLEELAREVSALRQQVSDLENRFVTAEEEKQLKDPQETWQAMNDPEKLGWRLDRFAKTQTAKMEDESKRQELLADVAAIKRESDELANMSRDELVQRYRLKLAERANSETNERMRRWFESQMQALDRGEERYIDNQLRTYRRYDTIAALKRLADKYKIEQTEMRDNGLPITGVAYGWE